tara:strand:+ start:477 stop:1133 length:657 start_codon:yes stop_codon:yes gene_type:complete
MFNSQLPAREDLPSTVSLLKSTAIALGAAGVLLVTVVLPAEYGIDPTRIGGMLGLTTMGEIKMQLAEEAEADRQIATETVPADVPANNSNAAIVPAAESDQAMPEAAAETVAVVWRDTISISLEPGGSTEVKLTMLAGDVAEYEWTTDQAGLNSDLHGDGPSEQFISYRQGRNEGGDAGEFAAEFDGVHGWFWRNRSEVAVTVTLNTRGEYTASNRLF